MPKFRIYQKHKADNPLSPAEQALVTAEAKAVQKLVHDAYIAGDEHAGERRLYNFDYVAEIRAETIDGYVYTDTCAVNAGTPFEARQYAIARVKAAMKRDGREFAWATVNVAHQ